MLDETPLAPLGPAGLVFMASGQGSQKPGMGADLLDIPEVANVFACASDVLGRDVAALVRDASPEELNDTRNAQIAIAALSVGMGRALEARGIVPDALLGFSLGQVSAMVLGGMLAEEDAFALIAERSRLMGEAADANPGVMSALLKITLPEAEALCAQCAEDEVLVPANLNGGGQIVVAGTPAAVARAEEAWAASKGRFSRLATSGAFHSPLMAPAQAPFADYLAKVEFREPVVPVIGNVHAAPLDVAGAREELVAHLVSPVQFEASVAKLQAVGAKMFAEVGFGGVLANLVKRIDRSVARELAAAGMNVVVNSSSGRSLPAAEAVAAEIAEEFGVETLAVAANVAIEEEANALIAAATEANGRVDVLVNNAGITRDGLAARMSDDDFDAVIDINLKGTFHCCRAAAKLMMKQRWGRIVNMSSVVGVYGNAGQVNYAASKAGVIGLTKSLARELARRNITANAVAPGFIATDMTDALSDAQREAIVSRIGSGRLGEPDDIAHLVRFLASDEASYITGQVICVDGGMSL